MATTKTDMSLENQQNLTKEVSEMLQSLAAIKGKPYTAMLRSIFGMCNYHMAQEYLVTSISEGMVKGAFNMLIEAHKPIVEDVMRTLMNLYVDNYLIQDPKEREAKVDALFEELQIDIDMLAKKQQEYGAFTIGGVR